MLPDKPIAWLIMFVAVIFVTHYSLNYAMGDSEPLLTIGFMSLITGFATIGLMFTIDEIRDSWFNEQ